MSIRDNFGLFLRRTVDLKTATRFSAMHGYKLQFRGVILGKNTGLGIIRRIKEEA